MNRVFRNALFLLFSVLLLAGCGKKTEPANATMKQAEEETAVQEPSPAASPDEYFIWYENAIIGLTEQGQVAQTLVIPSKCDRLADSLLLDSSVREVLFDGNKIESLEMTFTDSKNLERIILPEKIKEIGEYCFAGCSSLEAVSIPASVSIIGNYAFMGCTSLSELTFKGGQIKEIPEGAFMMCRSLAAADIPEGVSEIRESAFRDCSSLREISLPSTIKSIGNMAFATTDLDKVYFHKNARPNPVTLLTFGSTTYKVHFYIEEGSWMDRNRDQWYQEIGSIEYR